MAGFKEVKEEEKSQMVGNVFTNVASNYDLMNDLMSAGLHRLWKDRLVSELNPFPGMKHLDVAGGTGDVAFRILETIKSTKHRALQDVIEDELQEQTQIYVCDINPNMLTVGKNRALEKGLGEDQSLVWVEGDAEALSFGNDSMDGYTIAFGIRNVTHIEKALSEAYRVLKVGGRFLCLELSHVNTPVFKELYDYYSFSIIPAMGELVSGDRESYQYLVESIRRFPSQEKFASMIADAGFQNVEYENLVGGVRRQYSPQSPPAAGIPVEALRLAYSLKPAAELSSSREGLKRPKQLEKSIISMHQQNHHAQEEKIAHCPSPSSSGEPLEGESTYNKLLTMLSSSNKSIADAYKKRQRQAEGKSDTEEDEDSDDVSSSMSEDVDGDVEEHNMSDNDELHEGAGTEHDKETSDSDEEHQSEINDESTVEALVDGSSFHMHMGHNLSEIEADNLSKKKGKYKWELPAIGMSNCKWKGTGEFFLKDVNGNADYGLKPKLYKHWLDVYKKSGGTDFHSSKQRFFFTLCKQQLSGYIAFQQETLLSWRLGRRLSIMDAYIMHSLNHVFKTRDLVTRNDAQLAKDQENAKKEIHTSDSFLDHGFTRPKILILLPFASLALRLVKRLVQLTPSGHKVNVEHMDRFSKEFGTEEIENGDEDQNNSSKNGQDFGNLKPYRSSKPSDFEALFGGNNKDDFLFGIKFTRRSIKLYSDFYSSDMIVASAVGLLAKIGEADKNKEKDVDYLSSIEVLVIDYADVIAMQNWYFLKEVVERLNHIPSKQHGTDIMRIRQWYLNGYARFYRQTMILGSYLNPEMNSLFNRHCLNYQGKVKLECEYKGVLPKVLLQVQQVYVRFDADSIENIDNARLEYFSKKVFPKFKNSVQGGVMIFISSYFEFVRLRGFLKSQEASFCLLPEYAKPSDISRARVWFFEGKRKIMLYTERVHFYHRYKIRGIQNLIFYSLPERRDFYLEMVHMLEGSSDMACTALFSRFDLPRLERIVGTPNAKRMVKSDKDAFAFC
ncbi:hypothetical protein FNV43_RR03189 [Rhamnella rubrinervis]|uniref:2-methoxy-6-polyprenyl-1,4-benzoquinol methylase, mitochondrial n=1 Tax=Rhamnella rubrinervis TaxID=2594499 RepID=A0A8K0HHX6_9ROSA|nr:hypothetical protein FNV43_RR03189 [Rhamnella rubrinervis]